MSFSGISSSIVSSNGHLDVVPLRKLGVIAVFIGQHVLDAKCLCAGSASATVTCAFSGSVVVGGMILSTVPGSITVGGSAMCAGSRLCSAIFADLEMRGLSNSRLTPAIASSSAHACMC